MEQTIGLIDSQNQDLAKKIIDSGTVKSVNKINYLIVKE